MNSNLSGSPEVNIIRPYLELDRRSFDAFDGELESLTKKVHTSGVLEAHIELDKALERFQEIFQAEARTLGKTHNKEDYEHLKERVHAYYNRLAFPFVREEKPRPLAQVALRCYNALHATLDSLEDLTGYRFDHGLAYHNAGMSLVLIGDIERAVISIELADMRMLGSAIRTARQIQH